MAIGELALLKNILPEAATCGFDILARLKVAPPADLAAAQAARRHAEQQASEECVRRLLLDLGYSPAPVSHGGGGERVWPEGMVGSLTHKGTIVLGAASRTTRIRALGIDLEFWQPEDVDLASTVASEGLPEALPAPMAAALAFSAKEALFKAQYPLTRRLLEFEDIPLSWTATRRTPITVTAACKALPSYMIRGIVKGTAIVCAALEPS